MYEGISSVNFEFICNKQNQILLLAGYTEGVWQKKAPQFFLSEFFPYFRTFGNCNDKNIVPVKQPNCCLTCYMPLL